MTAHATPAEVAAAFIDAFSRRDMEAVARCVTEDVIFESPRTRLTGAGPVLAAVGEFAQAVTGVRVLAVVGDGERAVITYDMETVPFGTVRAADYLVVRGGRITSDSLVFDPHALQPRGAEDSR
ncbi:nuclear transport factor 2 family protein [Streptomyces sp. SBT349]|uniref:nuclear transport factor 2 family protein n=1 Tax=Streptomyces sp. SBT349 TaxID=1580539 RepID=UPI00066B91D9|nr:nuclear transport factor 2 family protein [Streptomyces sp. SBT349]